MIYALVIFTSSVLLWGINNYLKRLELSVFIKAIHLIISFILFQYYFRNFRTTLWEIFRNGTDAFSPTNIYVFNRLSDSTISILFFLCSFFVAGLSLNIAVRAKSRKLLLITSPLIALLTSLDLYRVAVLELGLAKNIKSFSLYLTFVLIVFGLINLFYNIGPGKKIFFAPNVSK